SVITKVYFPREIVPIAVVIANAVNFTLALAVLVPFLLLFGLGASWQWVLFPLVLVAQTLFTSGLALLLAGLNVYFHDIEMIMETLLLAWFFLTPVVYDLSQLSHVGILAPARVIPILNPVASYIGAYREIFVTHAPPGPFFLGRAAASGVICFVVGYAAFVRMSRGFGDVL